MRNGFEVVSGFFLYIQRIFIFILNKRYFVVLNIGTGNIHYITVASLDFTKIGFSFSKNDFEYFLL